MRWREKSVRESPNRIIYRATPLVSQRARVLGSASRCTGPAIHQIMISRKSPNARALWDTSGVARYIILFGDSRALFSSFLIFTHYVTLDFRQFVVEYLD